MEVEAEVLWIVKEGLKVGREIEELSLIAQLEHPITSLPKYFYKLVTGQLAIVGL